MKPKILGGLVLMLGLLALSMPAAELQRVRGAVPRAAATLAPLGRMPSSQRLRFAIGLPLRNQGALSNLLQQLYNPASPNFHHYLTPEQFTERFGPTTQDYEAVAAFALANGLTVATRHPNRTLLDVEGSVADVEKALHIRMNRYQHPEESRTFYAPDTDPTLDLAVPVAGISGLDNYTRPQPRLVARPLVKGQLVTPNAGSGPYGTYQGKDFRAAYAPDSVLTGSGQSVGLLQFDGYTASDITYYETAAGLPNVTLTNVLLDGFGGGPTGFGGEIEVSLDIEMSISMAPGLSRVIVYMAGPYGNWHDILNRMANDNLAKQLSCSWYIPNGVADPVADGIFQQMAAQGQSFMNASGDYGAYAPGQLIPFPGDTPYITQVGGTFLTTSGPVGPWVSETTWNRGGGIGTGGGISTQYPIPSWQSPVSMAANYGSTTMRNTPDVALTADNVYVRADGFDYSVGGTSCAAPLWAGFMSLMNQQAAANGLPTVGFLNPAVYKLGLSSGYTQAFHDITAGNNGSATHFPAVAGYDLCTGWGTPNGQQLINAIVPPDTLVIAPTTGFAASGAVGGPFTVTAQNFNLTNISAGPLTWSVGNPVAWLDTSSAGGVLTAGSATNLVASLNTAASNLAPGLYAANLAVTNVTSNFTHLLPFSLLVHDPLVIAPTNGFNAVGPVGGPFSVTSLNLSLSNSGLASLNWSLSNNATWLDASPGGGTLAVGAVTNVTVSLNATANSLPPALYSADLVFSNLTGGLVQTVPFTLQTGELPLQNNGFELGNFLGWTVSGNTVGMLVTSNALYVHSGVYGAQLGPQGSPGYLSQTLTTSPGEVYLISFWLENQSVGGVNGFEVDWNGSAVFNEANAGQSGWTNIQILVGATETSSVLQFGVRNDNGSFGLDDVAVFQSPVTGSPPTITTQPTNETVTAGLTTTFSGAATGIQPLYYQWQLGTSNIAGANSPTLVLSPTTAGEAGSYSLVVSNAFGMTNSSNAVLTVNVPVCDPPPSGLVGWWAAEGNANDSFGTNNGTLVGGAGFAPGEVGQAFSLNGVNQYVQVPDSTNWDFGTGDFSIELWAKFAAAGGSQTLVAHDTGSGLLNKWLFWLNGGQLQIFLYSTQTGIVTISSGSFNPTTNQWYHLGMTRSGMLFSFYVNGVLNGTATNGVAVPAASASLTMGETENSYLLAGQEDEVSIYSRAMSAAEIQAIYNAGSAGKCASPPVVVSQPQGQAVFGGSTVTFSVGASGTQPLSYQWSVNTSNLPAATNATLVLTDVQPDQSGNNYSVLVSNAAGSTNSSNAVLTVLSPGSCFPPPLGLISWWAGEGNAADSFGTNNGTLVGGAGFGVGEVGQAFSLNGVNQYVSIPDSPSWDFGTSDFSIELWVKFAATGGSQTLVAHDTGSGQLNKWIFWLNNGQLQLEMYSPGTGEVFIGSGTFSPVISQWYHIGVTRSGAVFSFYINGVLSGTVANGVAIPAASASLTLGAAENTAFLNGEEDEVSIYNRALSATEVQAIYNAGSAGKCPVAPVIVSQPQGQTVFAGNTVAFSVSASGSQPLTYQWFVNETNIPTGTNATLVLTSVPLDLSGNNYSVLVSNAAGSTNSSNALLTVNPPPPCTPSPSGLISWWAAEGNATDSFGTNNGTLVGGAGFASGVVGQAFSFNGTSQYVSIPDSPSWDFGTNDFSIELWAKFAATGGSQTLVAHDTGSGQLNKWIFWLNNGQLQLEMYSPGTGEVFIGSGTFSPVISQWYHLAVTRSGVVFSFYVNGVLNGTATNSVAIPAASASLTLGAAENTAFLSGEEDEVSTYNRALSATEIQTIYNAGSDGKCPAPPVIVIEPQNQLAIAGTNVTFAVGANGSKPLSYQWSVNQSNIPAATNASLVLSNVQPDQSGNNYSVLVSNVAGSTNSSNALLTVLSPGSCFPPPSGLVSWWAAEGNAADSFGTNSGTLVGGAGFAPGEVGQAFNFNGTSQYVSVPDSPSWDFGTSDYSIELWAKFAAAGGSQTLVAHDTGSGLLNKWLFWLNGGQLQMFLYSTQTGIVTMSSGAFSPVINQWYHLGVTRSGAVFSFYVNGVLNGTATNDVAIPAASAPLTLGEAENNYFFAGQEDEVSIYNRALSATEIQAIYLTGSGGKCEPHQPPTITAQPTNQAAVLGTTATFSVGAAGTLPLSYQWRFNQSNILAAANPTATNAMLVLSNVQPASAGSYSALVTNFLGSTNSSNAALTILFPPTITLRPHSQLVQLGCTVAFSSGATGTGALTYQWQKNGFNLPGQNGTNLALLNIQPADFANYTMIASNAYGSATSAVAVLALDHLPVPGGIITQRFPGAGVRLNTIDIAARATDADGDLISLISVAGSSVEGGTVALSGPSIYYTPPAGLTNADAFNYTISDGHCGGTAVGTILVNVRTDMDTASRVTIVQVGDGSVQVIFDGMPGVDYRVQSTTDLTPPDWQDITNLTADQYGTYIYTDWPATNGPVRYFRSVNP